MKKQLSVVFLSLSAAVFISCSFAQKKTELTFLETVTSDNRTAVIKQIIADFEKENAGISVNLISPPYDQAQKKLILMLDNEQPLDIIEVRDLDVKQYVDKKKLENLESRIASWNEREDLLPVAMACARTADGIAYGIPQFLFVKALFIRTDILRSRNITRYPETIDELFDDCIKITNAKRNEYGFDFRGDNGELKISDLLLFSSVPAVDVNNLYKTEAGGFSMSDPVFLKTLRKYIETFRRSVPADAVTWGFKEQIDSFITGTTPFLIQDADTVGFLDSKLGRSKYTVIPLPVDSRSRKAVVDYGFTSLSIPSYSKNKDAAWKFISYMSSAAVNTDLCKKYGPLPIHKSAFNKDPYFSTGVYQAWNTELNNPDMFVMVKFPLNSDKWPEWPRLHSEYMRAVMLGKMTPEDFISRSAEYWK